MQTLLKGANGPFLFFFCFFNTSVPCSLAASCSVVTDSLPWEDEGRVFSVFLIAKIRHKIGALRDSAR